MAMSTTLLRVLFMAVFSIAGFLLGREAYLHLISLHVANQAWLIALTIGVPDRRVRWPACSSLRSRSRSSKSNSTKSSARSTPLAERNPGRRDRADRRARRRLPHQERAVRVHRGASVAGGYVATVGYIIISLFAAFLGARVGAKATADGRGARRRAARPGDGPEADRHLGHRRRAHPRDRRERFSRGPLVLPRFVLRELQLIADSVDAMKRTRGRRGWTCSRSCKNRRRSRSSIKTMPILSGVDAKLVRMARERGAKLVTNDYNLNRVAQVEGVVVLNVNELAGAVKPVVLPGEEMHVTIVRDGKESHQGVGYLDDGTMIVVENARRLIGEETDVQVTSVLQTVAGRMIFANSNPNNSRSGTP
jgi:rRNA-processing protein FCF1